MEKTKTKMLLLLDQLMKLKVETTLLKHEAYLSDKAEKALTLIKMKEAMAKENFNDALIYSLQSRLKESHYLSLARRLDHTLAQLDRLIHQAMDPHKDDHYYIACLCLPCSF